MKQLIKISKTKYKKPKNTVHDSLTQEDIDILLEEYAQVENYNQLERGLHIRYYSIIKTKSTEKKLFRWGGTIINIDLDKKYIVLTNGRITWCVQLNNNNILFKKMSISDIKDFYENELDTIQSTVILAKNKLKKRSIQNQELLTQNQQLIDEIKNLNDKIEFQNKIIQKAKEIIYK